MDHVITPPPLAIELAATAGTAGVSVAATHASFIATHPWTQDLFAFLGATAAVFSLIASTIAIFSRLFFNVKEH
jgi:hypothetical protein